MVHGLVKGLKMKVFDPYDFPGPHRRFVFFFPTGSFNPHLCDRFLIEDYLIGRSK